MKSLRALREHMISLDWSRSYINASIGKIRRAFAWGVKEELVDVSVHQALLRVRGLQKGRSAARETEPAGPVDDVVVEATLPHLPPIVADMVRVQRLLGRRPGEVCCVRPCDLDTSGAVWVYSPATHKSEHRGSERRIFVGPKAQAILRPYLEREVTSYCSPPQNLSSGL